VSHIPVMLDEVLSLLEPCQLHSVFDGTCGGGGHAYAILSKHDEIRKYIANDQDEEALSRAKERLACFGSKVEFRRSNFSDSPDQLFEAILLDIGVSSFHLDDPERGFSFMKEGPLDMRMDREQSLTAADIVNGWDVKSLEKIFVELGQERYALRSARAIVRARAKKPFSTTLDLAKALEGAIPRRGKIHVATRIFQALRIAVNKEIEVLEESIEKLAYQLTESGRFLVITFHSGEDRVVKQAFRRLASSGEFALVNKKPLVPSRKECVKNRRSRSAKLRCIERKKLGKS